MKEAATTELTLDTPFHFDCHAAVSCFNACCRDLNQFLTPYDIVRLKNHLGISSTAFLSRYTTRHLGPQTRLPIVTLKPVQGSDRPCPFVQASGCGVYADRPSSCRIYPLVRVLTRLRDTGETAIRFALMQEPHCLGFSQPRRWTPRQWMDHQGLLPYNDMNDRMMEIIGLKNQMTPGYLPREMEERVFTLCYDLDRIREAAGDFGIRLPEAAIKDDEALLRFALDYLRDQVFARPFFQKEEANGT